jgi:HPt (histidine-containing phosphotransfer) domain-containing protein
MEQENCLIPGVDMQVGLDMTGGTMTFYRKILHRFCEDLEESLPALQNVPEIAALLRFIILVSDIKSAAATIGAMEVSIYAKQLEVAGITTDIDFIRENLPIFTDRLADLMNNIGVFLTTGTQRVV